MMSRAVAGLACRIRVPVRHYQAVAVLSRRTDHVIRLLHRDAGLSVDVEEFTTLETAEEYRDRLAEFLGLPPLSLAGGPSAAVRAEEPRTGSRRRNRAFGARRPRFLARRRTGAMSIAKVEGREIIARN